MFIGSNSRSGVPVHTAATGGKTGAFLLLRGGLLVRVQLEEPIKISELAPTRFHVVNNREQFTADAVWSDASSTCV
jgi:hypothetical protein